MVIEDKQKNFEMSLNIEKNNENRRIKKLKKYYCMTCGKEKNNLEYSSCFSCYDKFKKCDIKYARCLLCNSKKNIDKKGMCYTCYFKIKKLNQNRNLKEG